MLAKIYDGLTILLILCGIIAVGFVYYNRAWFFNQTVSRQNKAEHETLVSAKLQIESQWLKDSSNVRAKQVLIPKNTTSTVFVSGLNHPTNILTLPDGKVLVAEEKTGNIVLMEDKDKNNSADSTKIFVSGLNTPYGLDFYKDDLYVGLSSDVVVFRNFLEQVDNNTNQLEYLVRGVPSSATSGLPIKVFANKLYVGVSSSCNFCIESDKRRGSVVSYNLDGTSEEIYATGFKQINSIGEIAGTLAVTESSVNQAGVGDEFNVIRKGGFYGWPFVVNQSEIPKGSTLSLPEGINVFTPDILFSENSEPSGFAYSKSLLGISNAVFFSLAGELKIVYYNYPNLTNGQDLFLFDSYTPVLVDVEPFEGGLLISDYASGILYYLF